MKLTHLHRYTYLSAMLKSFDESVLLVGCELPPLHT